MVRSGRRIKGCSRSSQWEAVEHLWSSIDRDVDWPTALFESMAMWTEASETYAGRHFQYFIGGEAFDWLLLAERLLLEVDELISAADRETLLFSGRLPVSMNEERIQRLLGVEKYRGYLNYYYGVTVEEALQLAVEHEVLKYYATTGMRYVEDPSEEAFLKVYGASRSDLAARFKQETSSTDSCSMSFMEAKEFTYWLFKLRVEMSDKPKLASDTIKGLEQLEHMKSVARSTPRSV